MQIFLFSFLGPIEVGRRRSDGGEGARLIAVPYSFERLQAIETIVFYSKLRRFTR